MGSKRVPSLPWLDSIRDRREYGLELDAWEFVAGRTG